MSKIIATYRIRSEPRAIEERAQAIAVEQSVEMPVGAIDERSVLESIVGRVEGIEDRHDGSFAVRIGLAVATTGPEPGQLVNMLFGNTSIHDDVTLEDAEIPADVLRAFGGPRHGLEGLRRRCGAKDRAMTCSALKPQGLPAASLARIAARMAEGGIDYIKDDHGLADQAYSPFADRVRECGRAIRAANPATRYAPSLSGNLDQMRRQVALARGEGVDTVLIAPMVAGVATFHALVREFPDVAFMAHPALAGAMRMAPPFLLGRLFRAFGADATIFPNHGGRFGYTPATCRLIADRALGPLAGLKPCVPVPAGGMTVGRVGEMLDFYGPDVMLLIGGDLLMAREALARETGAFTRQVAAHAYKRARA